MQVYAGAWRLVHDNGEPVAEDEVVVDFRGEKATVVGGSRPQHEGSTGRVAVLVSPSRGGFVAEYFPSVYGLKWVKWQREAA